MCGGMGGLARTGGPGYASGADQGRIQAERFFLLFLMVGKCTTQGIEKQNRDRLSTQILSVVNAV